MIDLNDPETIEVLADLLDLQISRDRESVLAAARARCAYCGARDPERNVKAASASYAVMRPEYASLNRLKDLLRSQLGKR